MSSVEGLCFVDIGCGDGRLLQHAITKYKMIAFGIEIKEEFAQKLEANIVIVSFLCFAFIDKQIFVSVG